jgi:hypothetical protein
MKSTLLLIIEFTLILAILVVYALGYLPFPTILLFIVAWVSLRLRSLHWRDVGLRRPNRWLPTIGLALLVGIGYQLLDIIIFTPLLERLTGDAVDLSQFAMIQGNLFLLVIFLLVAWLEAAFLEELFFRGYLFNRFTDVIGTRRSAIIAALLLTSLIFGSAHYYQGITGILDTFMAGFLLGVLYLIAGRNLWLPILTHGVINSVGFVLLYLGLYG